MNKRHGIWLLFVLLTCLVMRANAALPTTETTSFSATYDKSSVPSSLYIWNEQTKGSGSEAMNVAMVCQSTTDTTRGACPTTPVWASQTGSATLTLRFVQDGTNAVRDIAITNQRWNGWRWRPVWNSINSVYEVPPKFSYWISQADLRNLTGGIWRATLIMDYKKWTNTSLGTTWTANIVLTVTDLNNLQIYFPAFPYTTPMVDLNLNNRPGTSRNAAASGSASLDMCLYDGSNSSSTRVNMLFSDEGASATGRTSGLFSVYRTGADKTQAANRIDYQVSVINPTTGAAQAIRNGTEITWTGTNRRNLQRQVVLPGVPGASLCVPAPIQLITPAFNLADKTAGHYTGKLTIIYTPSTQSSITM